MTRHAETVGPPIPLATRSRGKLFALFAATVLAFVICFLLFEPFLPAIVWSVTIAVVTRRPLKWLVGKVRQRTLAASIGVAAVALVLVAPVISFGYIAAKQLSQTAQSWQESWNREEPQKAMADWLADHPHLKKICEDAIQEMNWGESATRLAERLRPSAVAAISGPLYVALQMALLLFFLFYLYRDQGPAIGALRRLMPLSDPETDDLFDRLVDTIDATVYGKMVVALMQGTLVGIMFWILGLPSPVLWGAVMSFLAIIPYLGTFVIWAPAAAYLALTGETGRAIALAVWAGIVVGTIDNLVYPMLVREQLRQHTVVALVALLGGIALFGMTGLVLGPLAMTFTMFLLDVWRKRTAHGRAAEAGG